jgi:hypothetical protein
MPSIRCRTRTVSSMVVMADEVFDVMVSHHAVYRRSPESNARQRSGERPAETTQERGCARPLSFTAFGRGPGVVSSSASTPSWLVILLPITESGGTGIDKVFDSAMPVRPAASARSSPLLCANSRLTRPEGVQLGFVDPNTSDARCAGSRSGNSTTNRSQQKVYR